MSRTAVDVRRLALVVALAVTAMACQPAGRSAGGVRAPAHGASDAVGPTVVPGTAENFELVGSTPLSSRGMNSALAMYGHYAYVGNLSDGSDGCSDGSSGCEHPDPGVLVVDVADPTNPQVVGEIGPPEEGLPGLSSRELRVLPGKRLLMVMNLSCDPFPYVCRPERNEWDLSFFDLTDPARPVFLSRYVPPRKPHEMFLWVDHRHPGRALLYLSTPGYGVGDVEVMVVDLSRAREGRFDLLASSTWDAEFALRAPAHFRACGGDRPTHENGDVFVHSLGLNEQGTRAYLAYWCGQFLIIDTSDLARNRDHPDLRLLTPISSRPRWDNPHSHSAVKVPGLPYALTTDEVYGSANTQYDPPAEHDGCPWGWVRIVDVRDAAHPRVVSGYRIGQNTSAYCESPDGQDPDNTEFTSYSSHDPTVLPDLAFVSWHSGGLQAIDLSDALHLAPAGYFAPEPLDGVATENPIIGLGVNKDLVWSYPIVRNGLVYVVDIRNGLYVLRYTGPHADEVSGIRFLEGNSNLGDSARLARHGRRAA